jgi:AcrR family transcriptional regulator
LALPHSTRQAISFTELERSRTRNELLLAAAISAVGRYGVRGASLRDIAREAGCR